MIKEFFLGFIKIHILYHASREPVYGVGLVEELSRHGYKISFGTLYPTLHSLERNNLLRSSKNIVGGKQRKYYQITEKGEKVLENSREKIKELVDEVIYERQ
jgi:DNA-binding PadR family transcriptional regulator